MSIRRTKLSANEPCPCWSGAKYKHCCRNEVDWPEILANRLDHTPFMSARGRNILFAEEIFDALQFDNDRPRDLLAYKRAFTDKAVKRIHEAILTLWPPDTDLKYVFSRGRSSVSGLFTGDYGHDHIGNSVVRHSLYADKILLVSPFIHPYTVKPKFNPYFNPSEHRVQTLKNTHLFLAFSQWIDEGLVEFIHTPDDLDRDLKWASLERSQLARNDPDLQASLEETISELQRRHSNSRERSMLLLSSPDSYLRKMFREVNPDGTTDDEAEFISFIQSERESDPNFLETLDKSENGQIYTVTSGGNVEIANLTAELSNSYLFTDLKYKWHAIEKMRSELSAHSRVWSPFAKAMQGLELKFLEGVNLEVALRLRQENRLSGVRSVLQKAWKADLTENAFDEENSIYLAQNMEDEIRNAEAEWDSIQAELAKYWAAEGVAGTALVASGNIEIAAAATIIAATGTGIFATAKRRGFHKKFPASFFMNLDQA